MKLYAIRRFNVLFRVLFSYKLLVLTSMRSLTQLNVSLVFSFRDLFGLLKEVKTTFLCLILGIDYIPLSDSWNWFVLLESGHILVNQ